MWQIKNRWHSISPYRTAPTFNLVNVLTDNKVSLSDYESKRVILTYLPGVWAPWCRKMLEELNQSLESFTSHNFVLVAVIAQDPVQLDEYVEKNQIKFDILADPHGVVGKRFGIFDRHVQEPMKISKPVIFVMDKYKNIAHTFIGHHLRDRPQVNEIIAKASEPIESDRPKFSLGYLLRRLFYVGH